MKADALAPLSLGLVLVLLLFLTPPPPPGLWIGMLALQGGVIFLSSSLPGKILMDISYTQRTHIPHKSNGLSVLVGVGLIYALLQHYSYLAGAWGYHHYFLALLVSSVVSAIIGLLLFASVRSQVSFRHQGLIQQIEAMWNGSLRSPRLFSLPLGLLEVNRIGYTYACLLAVSIAFRQYEREVYEEMRPAAALYFGIPLVMYLLFVFLWVIDRVCHESQEAAIASYLKSNVGWKQLWWRSCILPTLYSIPLLPMSSLGSHQSLSPLLLISLALLYAGGYTLSRGSIQQRAELRNRGSNARIWGDRPIVVEFIPKGDQKDISGNEAALRKRRLLVSGWWGVVRHPRHAGELMIFLALTWLSWLCTYSWSVFGFIIVGIIYLGWWDIRARELQSMKTYGDVWRHYSLCVPYKLIPYVY